MKRTAPVFETWRTVPGYEGLYEVSDIGRVRSLPRPSTDGRVLRGGLERSRHRLVVLSAGGQTKGFRIHRLVCLAFHGPKPGPGYEVRHIDGDSLNNLAENLAWGTRSENMRDRIAHGTHHESAKTVCPRGHALVVPNLVKSEMTRGYRICLACRRALGWGLPRGMRLVDAEVIACSHRKYGEIMGVAA